MEPIISILIPVKNGANTLERCLQSIRTQTISDIEIIILDSMSDDGSRAIAELYGATIIDIPPATFNHGLTRNLGVQHCSGELIFLTVQDAWLPDAQMLEKMAHHFTDSKIMGVTGHQAVPHEKDKNPMLWFRRFSTPQIEIRYLPDFSSFENKSQSEKQSLIAWDNVVAMYRRSALIDLPFVKTEMSEDWMWSYQALKKGWTLLRDPSLVVYHYHHRTPEYVFNVTFSVNYHFWKFFGFVPVCKSIRETTFRMMYHIWKNKELTLKEKRYWIRHNRFALIAEDASIKEFLKLKNKGRDFLERGFEKYCSQIPMGKQRK